MRPGGQHPYTGREAGAGLLFVQSMVWILAQSVEWDFSRFSYHDPFSQTARWNAYSYIYIYIDR